MGLDPRGSLWRRWDLHVHTPSSIVHNYPGSEDEAWASFLDDLEQLPEDYAVLGINDYLFLDGYRRVCQERAAGRLRNIERVLPVVELRIKAFGGTESKLSKVNLHVVFSDELDPQVIQEQFLNTLSSKFQLAPGIDEAGWAGVLTRSSLEHLGAAIIESVPADQRKHYGSAMQEGFNNFTVSLDNVQAALGSSFLKGRYLTAVGKTEWADIKWKDGSIADKKHVINSADCVFTAAESPSAYRRARQALAAGGVNARLLDCSDAHHLASSAEKDRVGNCFTWIKADPTFGGLLQALEEFDQRVFVGEEPTQLRRIREHPSKYVDRVRVFKIEDSPIADSWFDVDLPLNPGLIAVIGNKGSGKSALAEAIGLVGGSPHQDHFSFLTKSKFRDSRVRLAENFVAQLTWRDQKTERMGLADSVEVGRDAEVQHLPQRYLESLCTEVPRGEKTRFDRELERIIFAHMPVDQRLGTTSLEELIAVSTGSIDTALAEQREALAAVNGTIDELEQSQRADAVAARRSTYEALRREWYALRASPPPVVPEPDKSDPQLAAVRARVRELGTASEHLEELVEHTERRLATVRRRSADLASFRAELEGLKRQHDALKAQHKDLLSTLEIEDDVSDFEVDTAALDRARERLAGQEAAFAQVISGPDGSERGLRAALDWIDQETANERAKLSAPEEARESYIRAHAEWQGRVESLRGPLGTSDPETVLGARGAFRALASVPSRLGQLREKRRGITRSIHRLLMRKAEACSELYRPLQTYMDAEGLPLEYELSVGTSLVDTGFGETLLEDLLSRHVAGSFCGVPESARRMNDLLSPVDFDDEDSVLAFLDELDELLRWDKRKPEPAPTQPSDQVRKGKSASDVYDWAYSLRYLSPRYGLLFGGKPIYQLSPGEKGTLLLVFFLLAELDTRPLIIDQPEDNLDNNTVYRALVKCFQIAKSRRQVLIVTHNPNLAVVCDADQIVVASMDKADGNRVTYDPGAIERVKSVRAVVDILEGTQPAFENRSVKYTMHLLGAQEPPGIGGGHDT